MSLNILHFIIDVLRSWGFSKKLDVHLSVDYLGIKAIPINFRLSKLFSRLIKAAFLNQNYRHIA